MNANVMTTLRNAVSALALVILFSPVAANAYTSNGTDGKFEPTVSMVLDSTQQIFNFTSIFIPSGVIISFSGLASAQPIEMLATENIDIAGTLDAGTNSLWIETPGSITLSGFLNASSGSTLSLVASIINLSGTVNIPGGSVTDGGGVLSICSNCYLEPRGTLSPVPEADVWVMLSLGLCALFAASRLRYRSVRLA